MVIFHTSGYNLLFINILFQLRGRLFCNILVSNWFAYYPHKYLDLSVYSK